MRAFRRYSKGLIANTENRTTAFGSDDPGSLEKVGEGIPNLNEFLQSEWGAMQTQEEREPYKGHSNPRGLGNIEDQVPLYRSREAHPHPTPRLRDEHTYLLRTWGSPLQTLRSRY